MFRHLLLWAACCLVGCNRTKDGPFEGQAAPAFEASTLSGESATLASFRAKPTVLVFWASWCGPCVKEAPEVARIATSYGSRINVVGINVGEQRTQAAQAAKRMGITWPVVLDVDGSIQKAYQVTGIPLILIVDQDGLVRHRNNGMPSDIHRLLDGLLG
jgi:cytochrome c biogenesis protein CcmG/thiol:disulfide interchange protein DsbE